MKCDRIKRKILLADSGELSDRQLEKIHKHLSLCRHCAEYRQDIGSIVYAAQRILPDGSPAPSVMSTIRIAAADKHNINMIQFRNWLVKGLACAAALMIVASSLLIVLPKNGKSARVGDLNTILAMIYGGSLDDFEYLNGTAQDRQLKTVANQLLIIEGFAVEEVGEIDFILPDA